ncbi:MAG: FixJ family two-component response regulator [Paraglaciecola sp.]|jgi:FixJ family two-component response regulator
MVSNWKSGSANYIEKPVSEDVREQVRLALTAQCLERRGLTHRKRSQQKFNRDSEHRNFKKLCFWLFVMVLLWVSC